MEFDFFFLIQTELNDKGAWTVLDYANDFDKYWKFDDNAERIHVKDVNCDEFIERFEKDYKPVVIRGIQVCCIK